MKYKIPVLAHIEAATPADAQAKAARLKALLEMTMVKAVIRAEGITSMQVGQAIEEKT